MPSSPQALLPTLVLKSCKRIPLARSSEESTHQMDASLPNGSFSCPIPNGAYCLAENIILRCIGSLGFPGNCNDNLAGEPPFGVNPTLCVTPCGNETGRAACSKNGIVYPASGVG